MTANDLLPYEREVIEKSFEEGDNNGANTIYYHSDRDSMSAEQFFTQTFQTNE